MGKQSLQLIGISEPVVEAAKEYEHAKWGASTRMTVSYTLISLMSALLIGIMVSQIYSPLMEWLGAPLEFYPWRLVGFVLLLLIGVTFDMMVLERYYKRILMYRTREQREIIDDPNLRNIYELVMNVRMLNRRIETWNDYCQAREEGGVEVPELEKLGADLPGVVAMARGSLSAARLYLLEEDADEHSQLTVELLAEPQKRIAAYLQQNLPS